MPNPTPKISSEAVEMAAKARHGRVLYEHWADVGGERRERLLEEARLDLEAAYPAIRSFVLEELREELLSNEALRAAEGQLPQPSPGAVLPDMGLCMKAALDSLASEGGER